MTGGQVQQWSSELGKWETVQMSEVSTYVATIIESIYELESSGATGAAVVGYFANDSKDVSFRGYKENGYSLNDYGNIKVDRLFRKTKMLTTSGYLEADIFISIGHELAHRIDQYENPKNYNDVWVDSDIKIMKRSELFATHIENQIRAESGLPLRKYYSISKAESSKTVNPDLRTRLIDSKGNSLFYKQTLPSIFDAVNRGEIFNSKYKHIKSKEAYNYYINNPKTKK